MIAPISGPVLPSTSGRTVWGSAAGLLFTWEPFDFGYRHATVNSARSVEQQSEAQQEVTRLAVATNAMDAFFTLLAAGEDVRVAQANVRQWEISTGQFTSWWKISFALALTPRARMQSWHELGSNWRVLISKKR